MTVEEMSELFAEHSRNEYLQFNRVANKLSKRRDLHAFMVLDKLFPDGDFDIIGGASHDEISLSIKPREFAEVATEDLILELVRCGVIYDKYVFKMYV